jgi:DEAD/DEAH box helicase domain-containing protein
MLSRILSWNRLWIKFYENLRFIIVDEAHTYRGVLGTHTAYIMRRLRRICNYYGSNPQFVISSATLSNSLKFSKGLVG